MLLSVARRREAERLAGSVEHLDLTGDSRFTDTFASALGF